jgi:hypothetical protein
MVKKIKNFFFFITLFFFCSRLTRLGKGANGGIDFDSKLLIDIFDRIEAEEFKLVDDPFSKVSGTMHMDPSQRKALFHVG